MEQTTQKQMNALAVYGTRDEVRELRERLAVMTPGGRKLTHEELAALAQGSIAHGLDPFNGEIWIIPGSGLMIGIKGLRKKAREQLSKGANFWAEFQEITNVEQLKRWRIPEGSLAFECRLYDTDTINLYVSTIERFQAQKIPWEMIDRLIGAKPYATGVGILLPGERTKMQAVQCAQKRAEADALKRRFDVPFGLAVPDDAEPDDTYPGEWVENAPPIVESKQEQRAADKAALFGDDETPPDPTEGLYTNTSKLSPTTVAKWTALVKDAIAAGVVDDFSLDQTDTAEKMAARVRDVKQAITAAVDGAT